MYGLKAIEAANGWIISGVGLCIVFTGLIVLYLFTSNLERLLGWWDRKGEVFRSRAPEEPPQAPATEGGTCELPEEPEEAPFYGETIRLTADQREVAEYFKMITDRLCEPFSLPMLLEQAEKRGVHRPYSHLETFLNLGLIEECEGLDAGYYRWRKNVRIETVDQ